MTKSNGIKSLKQAAKLLNKHAPDGESLAYINPEEGRVLKARGGSGIMTLAGVPTYGLWDTIVDYGKKALKYAPKVMDFFGSPAEAATPPYFPNYGSPNQMNPYFNIDDRSPNINYDYPPYNQSTSQHPTEMLEMANVRDTGSGNFLTDLAKGAWTGIKERYSDPKNIAGDLGKAWLTVESYKGQKDLNKFEQDKYDRALADIAAGEAQFAGNIGASPLEITNMPSETDIASFTDVTLPTMKTTAVAEGGRIGFNKGSKKKNWKTTLSDIEERMPEWMVYALMSGMGAVPFLDKFKKGGRIGYNMGGIDTPFQGIGALNPRMGYQDAGEVVEKTFSEGVEQQFPSDALGAINVNEEQMAVISDMNNKGMDTSLISTISGVDEDTVIRYIRTLNAQAHGGRIGYANGTPEIPEGFLEDLKRKNLHKKLEEYLRRKEEYERRKNLATTQEAAQGGRIGYKKASHPLDGVAIETFGMTFENLNPLQQIVITESQHQAKGPPINPQIIQEWIDMGGAEGSYPTPQDYFEDYYGDISMAKGGRIGAEKGGIMPLLDMGGMEKDYRQDGGFVPIGRKEKADDVPARLSKNEFVFTADAVKAAGGGDIDQGAQRMYNVMKNLEAGGQISQQSQGKR
jgi:hypothetical protein